ncbi:MAG: nucleotidyl transferase [Deltaproteobacteria bacterium]|nr:MAG: nucleotidyl transferase [Deltaproteobacteria bacterium]
MQAMILAAGFGTRLRPYTDFKPKPLFPVLNRPLLVLTIERLQDFGFTKIIVNCHHLQEQIVAELAGLDGVLIQQEDRILGTGGGLAKALALMEDSPILVTNGDIYHTIPCDKIYHDHCRQQAAVTLGMHDFSRFNRVWVKNGLVTSFDQPEPEPGAARLAFTGLQVINPACLEKTAKDSFSCVIDLYRRLIREKKGIHSFRTDAYYWTDIGTPDDYLFLHRDLLAGRVPAWKNFGGISGRQFIGQNVRLDDCRLDGWCVIGDNVQIGRGAVIKNSVVWPGCRVKSGRLVEDMICHI